MFQNPFARRSTTIEIPDWLLPEPSSSPPPVDDHRVEGLVNGFIAGKPDARRQYSTDGIHAPLGSL